MRPFDVSTLPIVITDVDDDIVLGRRLVTFDNGSELLRYHQCFSESLRTDRGDQTDIWRDVLDRHVDS